MAALPVPAPLWRRLVSMLYDTLLVAGLMMMAGWGLVVVADLAGLPVDRRVSQILYFAVGALYFGLSWSRGGQTLGMKAWRLHLRRDGGEPVRLPIALLRYAGAWLSAIPAGLGYLWALLDARRRCWHDLLAGTELIHVPKGAGD